MAATIAASARNLPPAANANGQLANGQNGERNRKRRNVIKNAKQQQPRQKLGFVEMPEPDQHRGIEYTEPAGRMAGEAEQCRGHENHRDGDEIDMRRGRHQHVHGQRTEPEIDNADHDLQQRQRPAGQRHRPLAAADLARLDPDPHDISTEQECEDQQRERAAEPHRQLMNRFRVNRGCRARAPRHCRARMSGPAMKQILATSMASRFHAE